MAKAATKKSSPVKPTTPAAADLPMAGARAMNALALFDSEIFAAGVFNDAKAIARLRWYMARWDSIASARMPEVKVGDHPDQAPAPTTTGKANIEIPLADLSSIVMRAVLHADKLKESNDVVALVKTMDRVATLADNIGTVKAEAEKLYDRIRFSLLPDAMDQADITNISVEGIGLCYLSDDVTVTQTDKDAVKQWLTDNGFEDLIKDSVNAQTLAAWVKGRMKAGLDYPTDLITTKPITRAAIKRK